MSYRPAATIDGDTPTGEAELQLELLPDGDVMLSSDDGHGNPDSYWSMTFPLADLAGAVRGLQLHVSEIRESGALSVVPD